MKTTTAAIGTLATALLAHVPCCGPTVLMALGGSGLGAGWLAGLEPYRPYFMGLSVITLGVGFWTAYKKPHSCHSCGECQSDVHAKRRARIGSMWAVAAMSVSLFIVAEINDAQHPHDLDGASFAQEQDQVFND